MPRPRLEVADIFRRHGPAYRALFGAAMPPQQQRAMRAIESCRTAALGGHARRCDQCGHQEIAYNSCRNRHCPKCQSLAKADWLQARRQELLQSCRRKEWVVYCKPPFGGAEKVLGYLGRYTHRIALSNHRLTGLTDARVSFRCRNYRKGGRQGTLTLTAQEFIRRFLLHVLPHGFMRIRSYGLLANCHRTEKLRRCRRLLGSREGPGPEAQGRKAALERPHPGPDRQGSAALPPLPAGAPGPNPTPAACPRMGPPAGYFHQGTSLQERPMTELNRFSGWIFRSCPGVPPPVRPLASKPTATAPQPPFLKAASGAQNRIKQPFRAALHRQKQPGRHSATSRRHPIPIEMSGWRAV